MTLAATHRCDLIVIEVHPLRAGNCVFAAVRGQVLSVSQLGVSVPRGTVSRLGGCLATGVAVVGLTLGGVTAAWAVPGAAHRPKGCMSRRRKTRRASPTAVQVTAFGRFTGTAAVPSVRRAVAVPARCAIQSARAPTEALSSIPAWGPTCSQNVTGTADWSERTVE